MSGAGVSRGLTVCAAIAGLAGCGADLSGDVTFRVLGPGDGGYALVEATVPGVVSARALRSDRFDFRRNAGLSTAIGPEVTVERGAGYELAYHLEGGVVVADDEESLLAMSAFAALSRAALALADAGEPHPAPMPVLYHPRFDSLLAGDLRFAVENNAAYAAAPLDGFVILPGSLGALPLFSNLGVAAHEYGHSVVQHLALGGVTEGTQSLSAMNEGVADLFGYAVSGDPAFIAPSVGDPALLARLDRDLASPKTYTQGDLRELLLTTPDAGASFDPHRHGAFLAAAVYEALPRPAGAVTEQTRRELAARLVRTLADRPFSKGGNALAEVARAYLAHLESPQQLAAACDVFFRRLAPLAPFPACPPP